LISILESFLGKLGKRKGYVLIKNPEKVKNLNQIFKVFKEGTFNEELHILTDTLNILGSLSERERSKLK